jgi:hypothetical protein
MFLIGRETRFRVLTTLLLLLSLSRTKVVSVSELALFGISQQVEKKQRKSLVHYMNERSVRFTIMTTPCLHSEANDGWGSNEHCELK